MVYRFVMNLKTENSQFIEKAAEETKFDIIIGKPLGSAEGFVGIYIGEPWDTNLDKFWDRYEELEQNAESPTVSSSNLSVS